MFHPTFDDAQIVKPAVPERYICFVCGKKLIGPTVAYHASAGAIFMHPVCGSEMAQVIITDSWPNRRAKEPV